MKYIIYHGSSCSDGFGSAWAAHKNFGNDAQYIPAEYGKPLPEIPDDSDVFMLDISYPKVVLVELKKRSRSLLMIDHHKTAWEELEGLSFAKLNLSKSGAVLTWEHFFPGVPVPQLLKFVQDRDLWEWKLPMSKKVSAALQSRPYTFEDWNYIDEHWNEFTGGHDDNGMFEILVDEGTVILRLIDQQVKTICDNAILGNVLGFEVPVVNTSLHWSEIGHELLQRYPDNPFAASYTDTNDGRRKWSLRSRKDFDVSEIARLFGGGGHHSASGFTEKHRDMWWRVEENYDGIESSIQ